MKAKEIGNIGENMACEFLLKRDYEILQRNFTKPFGEIDIIAKDKDCLVFIEVKARKNTDFGYPRDFVNKKKIEKIINVAQTYMMENKIFNKAFRFDVIEIIFEKNEITHLKNAF